jgi:nitronate monooxygenase
MFAPDWPLCMGTSMALPNYSKNKLRLPLVGARLFIISHPALVIAQYEAGIVGAFPALNARPISQLDEWLHEITEALAAHDRAHPETPRRAVRRQPDRG